MSGSSEPHPPRAEADEAEVERVARELYAVFDPSGVMLEPSAALLNVARHHLAEVAKARAEGLNHSWSEIEADRPAWINAQPAAGQKIDPKVKDDSAVRVYVPTDVRPEMLDGTEAQALRDELDATRVRLEAAKRVVEALREAVLGSYVRENGQQVVLPRGDWLRILANLAALPAAASSRAGDDS